MGSHGGSSPLTRGKRLVEADGHRLRGLIPAHAGKTILTGIPSSLRRAHPRSRGENVRTLFVGLAVHGSSPLTRGKPGPRRPGRPPGRLIPAHAGKTPPSSVGLTALEAHPRSRGENAGRSVRPHTVSGSSPLTRGKPRKGCARRARRRLIPAHAGKTFDAMVAMEEGEAHPRSRGENEALAASDATDKGSSPLTRGKRRGTNRVLPEHRLIPAHAGKTAIPQGHGRARQAHPRSRGENFASMVIVPSWFGSSPLTRGKPRVGNNRRDVDGLIPAHAGKTRIPRRARGVHRAHPRSRGENHRLKVDGGGRIGSSPLTRGKLASGGGVCGQERLIPAHAGKTSSRRRSPTMRRAHPRSRGENLEDHCGTVCLKGSSPLTRGKPDATKARTIAGGLIPAHAGKT